ncbi:hypothetical protein [Pseudoalteromonas phenolica]|uniref:hypothetical protein n=1 Tax=Pseudoalteromonas phenolica TaxID=161398 RepID=UPI001107E735|nr:hypothetical protein [Pseudoalteromonas phenolica]
MVKYISNTHPKLYGQLEIEIGAARGESMEVDGNQFHKWLLDSSYEQLDDDKLSYLASNFKAIRIKSICLVFIGFVMLLISVNL